MVNFLLKCYLSSLKVIIPIHLPNEISPPLLIPIEVYSYVSELKHAIFQKLNIFSSPLSISLHLVSLLDRNGEITEEGLNDEERVMDVVGGLEELREDFNQRVKVGKNKGFNKLWFFDYRIGIKIWSYFKLDTTDLDSVIFYYLQHQGDVRGGRFPLKEEDIIELTGISLLLNHGDEDPTIYERVKKKRRCYLLFINYY